MQKIYRAYVEWRGRALVARWLCPERVAGWRAGERSQVVGGVAFALCAVGWVVVEVLRAKVDFGTARRVLLRWGGRDPIAESSGSVRAGAGGPR